MTVSAEKRQRGAKSGREMATRLSLSESGFRKFRDSDNWPTNISKSPPWTEPQVQRLIQVREELAEPGDDETFEGMTHERRAKLRLLVERGAKVKVERLILEGSYVARADLERREARQVAAVRAAFFSIPRRVARECHEAKQVYEIERIIEAALREVCIAFADGKAAHDPAVAETLRRFDEFLKRENNNPA